jgi:hypothetical protein
MGFLFVAFSYGDAKSISIIIPTYNEAATIGKAIDYLQTHSNAFLTGIIVSDAVVRITLYPLPKALLLQLLNPQKRQDCSNEFWRFHCKGKHSLFCTCR